MTFEEVLDWLIKCMDVCIWIGGICATVVIVGIAAGYFTERVAQDKHQREGRCINSACDSVCKPNARFVRHQGCEVSK